ncbi:Spo0B domain-containing protein [Paenibacillus sp. 481]|nr:Spo0B domain-containing protein [Paenibacillus sp. 481]
MLLIVLNVPLLWRIVTVIILIASLSFGANLYIRERIAQERRLIRAAHSSALDLMHHQRHDWMNDLQLLYGYVRLKKYDKLPVCVETIKARMTEESRISKLGVPELVMFIMHHRTSGGTMPLQVSIPDSLELNRLALAVNEHQLTDVVIQAVQTFRFAPKVEIEHSNPLHLAFAREPEGLVIRYQYEGKLLRPGEVAEQLKRIASERNVRLEQLSVKQDETCDVKEAYQLVVPCSA